jgi:MinD-like ATPase involved in chromosome partitioning or flagellar assembly
MARVFFVSGGKGGVRKSVGAIALLDYFQMGNRKVSLMEGSTLSAELED